MKYINQIVFLFVFFFTCLSHAMLQWTPLHEAAEDGNLEQVRQLLDGGANVNFFASNSLFTLTPLHVAAWNGHEAVARLLLDRGANINATVRYGGFDGLTPLYLALMIGSKAEAVARLLLKRGADVNATDQCGNTPLLLAVRNKKEAIIIIRLLLERGANVNAVNQDGYTPLHRAEQNNHTEVATLLRRWPTYQELIRERREGMLAFLMAAHPHLGSNSPVNILPKDLFQQIWTFVKPAIEEATEASPIRPTSYDLSII